MPILTNWPAHETILTRAHDADADCTPASVTLQIAYMISGMIYFMWSLHCGFIIPEPSYPGWWVWLYYINPVSWILYGFVASQLGRVTSSFEQVGAFLSLQSICKTRTQQETVAALYGVTRA